jgi:hypothetical protein
LAAIGAEKEIQVVTNVNGTAWRFPGTGVQICTHISPSVFNANNPYGYIWISPQWITPFPAAFTSPPTVAASAPYSDAAGGQVSWALYRDITETTGNFYLASGQNNGRALLAYIAVGPYTP